MEPLVLLNLDDLCEKQWDCIFLSPVSFGSGSGVALMLAADSALPLGIVIITMAAAVFSFLSF